MSKLSLSSRNCAVARSMDVVGEWWSMLIILELFSGSSRFDEFQSNLGISRSILTNRLNKLVKNQVVRKLKLNTESKRQGYFLTDKGRGLLPALVALHQWGNQWLDWEQGQPLYIVDYESKQEVPPIRIRDQNGEMLLGSDLQLVPGEGADEEIIRRFGPTR